MIADVKNKRCAVTVEINNEYSLEAQKRLESFKNATLKFKLLGKKIYKHSGNETISKIPDEWMKI